MATTATSLMGNSLLGPAIPDILDDFDRPDSASGLLIAATSAPGIVMAPVIGILADRFGRRRVLTPCLAIFGLAGIAIAAAPTFAFMLAARFALGLGAAGLVNLAVVLISDNFQGEERTRWIGYNAGVLTVTLAVAPVIGGLVTEVAGWRLALTPQAIGLATAVLAWRTLDDGQHRAATSLRAQLGGAAKALRHPATSASALGAMVAFAVLFGVFLAAMPVHLEEEFGLSAGWRGVLFGLPALTSALVAFNLKRIRERMTTPMIVAVAATMWVVTFAVLGVARSLVFVVPVLLLYGLGEGAMLPSLQDAALAPAPDDQRAAVMAGWVGSARLGQTVGPLTAGAIMGVGGTRPTLLTGAVLAGLLYLIVRPLGSAT